MRTQRTDELMERLGRSGVTAILKFDHERTAIGDEPWAVVLSGPGVGDQGFIRAEDVSLSGCLDQVLGRLRSSSDQWDWLTEHDA